MSICQPLASTLDTCYAWNFSFQHIDLFLSTISKITQTKKLAWIVHVTITSEYYLGCDSITKYLVSSNLSCHIVPVL